MSKVIFFCIPSSGHTNPTLAVVKELVDRGEEVIYYSFECFRETIEKTGAVFKTYNMDISKFSNANNAGFSLLYRTLMEINEMILDKLLDEIKELNPDYIIHDSLCSWAKYIANILNIPAVSSITIFAFAATSSRASIKTLLSILLVFSKDFIIGRIVEKRMSSRYNIKTGGIADAFMSLEKLNIVYTSKEFQPNGEYFDDSFKFVGPSLIDREEKNDIPIPEKDKKPVVYISLGTVASYNPAFYEECFKAFGKKDLFIILSLGNKIDIKMFKNIPENFTVRDHVAQLEILQKSDVFVTHGGMNSVHEGLYHGVPMVVAPQHPEQAMVAQRVHESGAGIHLKTVNANTLESAVQTVLSDNKYKANCLKLSETMKAAGGYKRAADEIMAFTRQNVKECRELPSTTVI